MSRHRIVRSMNYEDEYYDDEDEYSRSVEDNYCISPSTAAQFTWNREKNVNFASYMNSEEVIDEEDEYTEDDTSSQHNSLSDSATSAKLKLSEIDQGKLNSCLEEARNILGESFPEPVLVEVIIENDFNLEAAVSQLFTQQDVPKPQREPRQRRNRTQDDKDVDDLDSLLSEINTFAGRKLPQPFSSFGSREKSEKNVDSHKFHISTENLTNKSKHHNVKEKEDFKYPKPFHVPKNNTESSSSGHLGQAMGNPKALTVSLLLSEHVNQKVSPDLAYSKNANVTTKVSQDRSSLSELIAQRSSHKRTGGGATPHNIKSNTCNYKDQNKQSSLMKLIQVQHMGTSTNSSLSQTSELKSNKATKPSLAELAAMHKKSETHAKSEHNDTRANKMDKQLELAKTKNSSMSSLLQTLSLGGQDSNKNVKSTNPPLSKNSAKPNTPSASLDLSLSSCLKTFKNGRTLGKDTFSPFSRDLKDNLDTAMPNPMEDTYEIETDSVTSTVLDAVLVSTTSSTVGQVLCFTSRKRKHYMDSSILSHKKIKRYSQFACEAQVKGRIMYKDVAFQSISPFSFDSLSPDDIVRQKQKQAFTRPDKEFTL